MAKKQFSANLSFTETEFRAPVRTNLNNTKAGAILPATTGYCLIPTLIENENQLISNFGYPTNNNYKFWFDCSGFLKSASSLYVVRPLIDGSDNKGISVNTSGNVAPTSEVDLYNEEVALNTLDFNITADGNLKLFNRFINKNNDTAVVVISNTDAYKSPLFNDYKLVSGLSYYFKKPVNHQTSGVFDIQKILDHSSTFTSNSFGHVYQGTDFIVANEATFGAGQTNEPVVGNVNKIGVFADVLSRFTVTGTINNTDIVDGTEYLLKVTYVSPATPVWLPVRAITRTGTASCTFESLADDTLLIDAVDANLTIIEVFNSSNEATKISEFTGTLEVSEKRSNVVICQEEGTGYAWVDLDLFIPSDILPDDTSTHYFVYQKLSYEMGNLVKYNYYKLNTSTTIPELADASASDEWHLIVDGNNYNIDVDGKFYQYNTTTGILSLYGKDNEYEMPLGYNMVYTKTNEGIKVLSKIVPKYLVDSLYSIDGSILRGIDVLSPTPNFSKNEVGVLIFKKEFNSRKFDLIETFVGSYASNAKSSSGASNYIETVINKNSSLIYCKADDDIDLTTVGGINTYESSIVNLIMIDNGDKEYDRVTNFRNSETDDGNKLNAVDLRTASDEFSVRGNTLVNLLISYDNGLNSGYLDDMSEIVKESGLSLAIASYNAGDLAGMKASNIRAGIIDALGNKRIDTTSGALTSFNDYTFVIGTSKLLYDKYNDKDRWVSLAGDVAGYMASNDQINGSWFPVAGIERGIVSNYKRLLWSPSAVDQNELSRNGLNCIINDRELGYAYIFEYITNTTEDKITAEANVRRLVITLKDYLRTTLKGTFYSFNDAIERNAVLYKITDTFTNIQRRRGLYDFRLICDESNNTADVINQNQFVIDVLIQPTRMVKYIKVNFLIFDAGFNLQEFEI